MPSIRSRASSPPIEGFGFSWSQALKLSLSSLSALDHCCEHEQENLLPSKVYTMYNKGRPAKLVEGMGGAWHRPRALHRPPYWSTISLEPQL